MNVPASGRSTGDPVESFVDGLLRRGSFAHPLNDQKTATDTGDLFTIPCGDTAPCFVIGVKAVTEQGRVTHSARVFPCESAGGTGDTDMTIRVQQDQSQSVMP